MTRPTAQNPEPAASDDAAVEPTSVSVVDLAWHAGHALASLKLTVVLFAMAIFLVFAGTVAQIDHGIWTILHTYFRTYLTWIPLQIFFPRTMQVPGGFWFPGGWLIGGALLVNILAAHTVRFTIKARGQRLVFGVIITLIGVGLTALVLAGVFQQDVAATKDAAFWRVLLRLVKGGVAALVLLWGCRLLFNKRAGIVLLHGGIILMLMSELFTGLYAVEGQMRIHEGQTLDYVYHLNDFELVVTDRSDSTNDLVTAVSAKLLKSAYEYNTQIISPKLPFDIRVERYMPNSTVERVTQAPNNFNMATAGLGKMFLAIDVEPNKGVDRDQSVDIASAYLTLIDKKTQQPIGTYMVSGWLSQNDMLESLNIGGKPYEIGLRFARTYKSYSVHLKNFSHKVYMGTDKAKDFSSYVRLIDPSRGVDREVRIWMNNPLRYAGETFYQSSFDPKDPTLTVLQVVKNKGWMIPYVACMIVATGLAAHFGMYLVGFLRKRGSV